MSESEKDKTDNLAPSSSPAPHVGMGEARQRILGVADRAWHEHQGVADTWSPSVLIGAREALLIAKEHVNSPAWQGGNQSGFTRYIDHLMTELLPSPPTEGR